MFSTNTRDCRCQSSWWHHDRSPRRQLTKVVKFVFLVLTLVLVVDHFDPTTKDNNNRHCRGAGQVGVSCLAMASPNRAITTPTTIRTAVVSRFAVSVGKSWDDQINRLVTSTRRRHPSSPQGQEAAPWHGRSTGRRRSIMKMIGTTQQFDTVVEPISSVQTITTAKTTTTTRSLVFPPDGTTTTTTQARLTSSSPNSWWWAFGRGGAKVKRTMTARQMEALNLLSGGLAGTVSSTMTNPLEVIKTQLQSSNQIVGTSGTSSADRAMAVVREILRIDGVAGFFRGLPATLVGIVPARSVYFYAYQRSRKALDPYVPQGSPPNALLAGFFSGIAANTITNPIWMVRTRMQLLADSAMGQVAYSGYWDAIATIFREEGLAGFYRGVAASYWGCTEGAAQFLMYEQLKAKLLRVTNRRRRAKGLPPTDHLAEWSLFLSAAASKMVASIATYPHEVARTRLREQAKLGVFRYSGMWNTLSIIAKEEGRQGLYSGMGVHLLKVVPNSALMFLTYELVRKWLGEFQVVKN